MYIERKINLCINVNKKGIEYYLENMSNININYLYICLCYFCKAGTQYVFLPVFGEVYVSTLLPYLSYSFV